MQIQNVPNPDPSCCRGQHLCDDCLEKANAMLQNGTVFNKNDTLGIPQLSFSEEEEQSETRGRIVSNANPDDDGLSIPTLEW
jgi:hypothetical protein